MYTLLYLKLMTNKDLLYSTGNTAQCYVAAWIGGEFGGEWIHVYVRLSPFIVHLKLSQHCQPVIAQGTLLSVTWQLGWEGCLGENGYMYMYS